MIPFGGPAVDLMWPEPRRFGVAVDARAGNGWRDIQLGVSARLPQGTGVRASEVWPCVRSDGEPRFSSVTACLVAGADELRRRVSRCGEVREWSPCVRLRGWRSRAWVV